MSEDLKKAASGKKSAHKAVTSTPALILVMLVEFVMFAFYPFLFLVIIPYSKYDPYPENFCEYHNDTKEVVLTTDRYILSYIDWETKEQGDGSNILFIPAGSTIEVSRVNMHDYPEAPAYIGISYYYDENGKGYTLWDNISLLCIENPEEIFNDLDAIRAAEKQNNESVRTKTITGFVITIVAASVAVLMLYLFLKKNLARHVVAASILVLIVYVLLFSVGQIAANIYYDVILERLGF